MANKPPVAPQHGNQGFKLTGFIVLMMFVAFFGTDIAINVYMATTAIHTFSGEVSSDPYQQGLNYDKDVAAARAQDARNWRVTVTFSPAPNGQDQVEVRALDAAGKAIEGLTGKVVLKHPSDMQFDSHLVLGAVAPGIYRANFKPHLHDASVVIDLARDGQRMFRSVNHVTLPGGMASHG